MNLSDLIPGTEVIALRAFNALRNEEFRPIDHTINIGHTLVIDDVVTDERGTTIYMHDAEDEFMIDAEWFYDLGAFIEVKA